MNLRSRTRRSAAVVATSLGIALAASLATPTTANAGSLLFPDTATANLQQFTLAGVPSNITATMNFSDNGLLLSASGQALNLDPNSQYVSLLYGRNSNADPNNINPGPCVDDGTLGAVISQAPGAVLFSPVATSRMLLGLWGPPVPQFPNGNIAANFIGTKPVVTPLGVTLKEVNTVSIRRATTQLDPLNLFSDIRPQVFQLMACGLVIPNNYTPNPAG